MTFDLSYTRVDQKITVIFKFREMRMFDLRLFFIFWIVSLFLTDKNVSRILERSSIFFTIRIYGSNQMY